MKPERLKFDGPSITELPIPAPLSYMVVIRPRPPRTKLGTGVLVAATRTQNAERATTTIGQVLALGPLAFRVATSWDPALDYTAQSIKPGDWVQYRQHAGQKLRIKRDANEAADEDNARDEWVITLTDTDVLSKFAGGEAEARRFYDWSA